MLTITQTVIYPQAEITIPVIDRPLRFPQHAAMITHDEIKAELIRQIESKQVKQAAVARHLNVAPARISEIRAGDRRIQPDEMPKLAEFLGMIEPDPMRRDPVESVDEIPNLGRVAQGVWMEQTETDLESKVAYDRLKGDPPATDLFAVTPEGTSMNLRFMPGTKLICRRVPFGIGGFQSGDYVIAKRTAHDLYEMTCKRVEIDEDGVYWLYSESSDPKFAEPWRIGKPDEEHHLDVEVEVIAKVIRAVQDFENRRQ
jgi:SOS-response transcriptional repressor LexA